MTTTRFHFPPAAPAVLAQGARGFTLIEVLIALALGVGILLALTRFFASNSGNQAELERTIRQLESARFSLDTLAEDAMHAGYYSDFNPDGLLDPPAYQTPDPCAVATNAQGWDTSVTPVMMPVPLQGIAASTVVNCLGNRRAATEAIIVRRADTGTAIAMAGGRTDNLYIQVARCTLDVQRIVASPVPAVNASATFTLRRPDCATINDALRRLVQRTYYVATCNDCVSNDGIPTLKRVEMVDGVLRTASIAEGVEDLQIEYGLDNDGDGQPNTYGTMGSGLITGAAPNVWQNVVAVRIHLLTRGTQNTTGYADARTYQIGPDVSLAAPADGFKRTLVTTTVRLLNVGMRRE